MSGLDYFSWIVLIVIVLTVVAGVVALARLPGQIATENGHPNANAINFAGWLGIINGVSWIVAMVWANTQPAGNRHSPNEESSDARRIAELEARISQLETAMAGDS